MLMLLFFVFVVLGITLYQERKTERVLAVRAATNAASQGARSCPAISCCSRKGITTEAGLDRTSDDEVKQHVGAVTVYARIVPEQKLRLVNANLSLILTDRSRSRSLIGSLHVPNAVLWW